MIYPVSFSGVTTNKPVKNNKSVNKTHVTDKQYIQREIKKQTPNKNQKLKGLLWAGLALAAGTAVAILSRGKIKARRADVLKDIPHELQVRFEKLKNLSGKDFIDNAYNEMVDYMGLKGIAPKEILINGNDGLMSITGGYNPMLNKITYSSGFVTKLTKDQQLTMLSHELKHCEQFTNMLRTEGLTVEKYVESTVDNYINNAIRTPYQSVHFSIAYSRAREAGTVKEFLAKMKNAWIQELAKEVRQNFAEVLKLSKFKADSPEARKAFEHLRANSEYEGLNIFGTGSDTYRNNPLEVEAYAFGDKIGTMFKKFLSV